MFERLQRELTKLGETTSISVPLSADAEGYLDKECPSEPCLFEFKIFREDWKDKCRDEEVFCPSCRHAAPARSWFTTEQIRQSREYAINSIKHGFNQALREDASAWNRRQKPDGFLSITMKVEGGIAHPPQPPAATEPMRLRAACEECGCRYSYVGAAYFCPACGANSAGQMFSQTIAAIRTAAGNAEKLRASFEPDEAEVLVRALLEKAMQDTVTSFQRVAERAYERFATAAAARRNAFQSLGEGSMLWAAAAGQTYENLLGAADLARLHIYFQQRHLLSHTQGIVDADYVSKSGDSTYVRGQRIVLAPAAVMDFATLTERLGASLLGAAQPRQGARSQTLPTPKLENPLPSVTAR